MNAISPPEVLRIGAITVIRPGAEYAALYENLIENLAESLKLAETADPPRVVFDMQNVKFIGSAFLGRMVTVQKTLAARESGRFGLCGVSSFCRSALAVSKLDSVLQIFPTVDEAVKAFDCGS